MRWLVVLIVSALMIGCMPKIEKEKKAEDIPEKVVSRDEAIKSLPCFSCHSYQKFSASQKGMFPHQKHLDVGYHCNQCHEPIGHRQIVVNMDVCANCHNIKVIAFKKTVFPSQFNHESHSRMYGCKECHPKIFLMSAGATLVTMKDIYKGAYCGACHDGKKAFSSTECSKCHNVKGFAKELTYKIEGIGSVIFSHKFHTDAFACDSCHPNLFNMKKTQGKMKMDDMYDGKLCGACHNGNIAASVSDCGKCHKE
jgi:c(7)-type cytochrome triheme protein